MTTGAEPELVPVVGSVSRGTLAVDAVAVAGSWSPNTRRVYVAGWQHFTSWCLENVCAGVPSEPADVGRYLEHLVETEGKSLATAWADTRTRCRGRW